MYVYVYVSVCMRECISWPVGLCEVILGGVCVGGGVSVCQRSKRREMVSAGAECWRMLVCHSVCFFTRSLFHGGEEKAGQFLKELLSLLPSVLVCGKRGEMCQRSHPFVLEGVEFSKLQTWSGIF